MTTPQSFDEYLDRAGSGYFCRRNFCGQFDSATTGAIYSGQRLSIQVGSIYTVEAMPPGVSAYRLCSATLRSSVETPYLLCKIGYLGAYNLGTSVFDPGDTMPSIIEGGITRQVYSSVLMYAANNLTLTGGTSLSIRLQYVDQNNNSPEFSPAVTLTPGTIAGSGAFARLNSGDYGVLDITGCTTSGSGTYTGLLIFLGLIPLGVFNPILRTPSSAMTLNFLTEKPDPPIVYANDSLVFLNFSTVAKRYQGSLMFVGEL